jgi:hypothetical protein
MKFRMMEHGDGRMTEHLYNAKDVKIARDFLLKKQKGLDAITNKPIPKGKEVLDHCHSTQYVRGVLHTRTNVMLGKVENAWIRYMAWWCPVTLPTFLRGTADYLERKQPEEYVHPAFVKRLEIDFKALKEGGKTKLLSEHGVGSLSNATERVKAFKGLVNKKDRGFSYWANNIQKHK